MKTRDRMRLEEAYCKIYIKEEEDPSEYNSKHYDSNYQNWNGKTEDFEFVHNGETYMAEIAYDIEEVYDRGDYDTPPSSDYNIEELAALKLYYYNPESGEYEELNREQNPEMWQTLAKFAEQQFLDNPSNYNPEY